MNKFYIQFKIIYWYYFCIYDLFNVVLDLILPFSYLIFLLLVAFYLDLALGWLLLLAACMSGACMSGASGCFWLLTYYCWLFVACLSVPFCRCCCLGLLAAVGVEESLFVRIENSCIPSESWNNINFIISLRNLYRHIPKNALSSIHVNQKMILITHMNDRTQ